MRSPEAGTEACINYRASGLLLTGDGVFWLDLIWRLLVSAKLDLTCTEFTGKGAEPLISTCPHRFSVLWNLWSRKLKLKWKMIRICPEGRKWVSQSSRFSWSDLEPLFTKQKQAVWLTAQDNLKGMKTSTITVPFLLTVLLFESQQQITGFQSSKPTPTDRKCVCNTLIRHHIHNDANRHSESRFEMFLTLICRQADWTSISDLWALMWCNIWYMAKVNKPHVSQKRGKLFETWKFEHCEDEWKKFSLGGHRWWTTRSTPQRQIRILEYVWTCRPVVWSSLADCQLIHYTCSYGKAHNVLQRQFTHSRSSNIFSASQTLSFGEGGVE